jgi:6-phosphogluconolactonase
MLGMGADGHIASIFPENSELMSSDKICAVAVHPVSGQKRITITGKVINNAGNISLIVTGHSKARAVKQIFNENGNFPASLIIPLHGRITWLVDEKAGKLLRL